MGKENNRSLESVMRFPRIRWRLLEEAVESLKRSWRHNGLSEEDIQRLEERVLDKITQPQAGRNDLIPVIEAGQAAEKARVFDKNSNSRF